MERGRTGSRGVPQAAPQPAGPLPGPTAVQAQQPSTPPAIPRGSRTGRPDRRAHVSPAAGGPPHLPIHSTRRVLLPRIQQLITGPSAATSVSLRAAPGTGGVASAFYGRPGTRDQDIRQEGGPRAELFSQASAPAAILATPRGTLALITELGTLAFILQKRGPLSLRQPAREALPPGLHLFSRTQPR
ncbi:hypothetical protein NDU88_008085 [Pleurodeles waltl]|uniref:Uncharacterized protein n=1 Tax=Pleurodeles waltl TaxID=8319 RepID=A0AAV7U2C7_PLEWA|nr:hypothetical protein NDU88_008085 [Pleurodeles waltl]